MSAPWPAIVQALSYCIDPEKADTASPSTEDGVHGEHEGWRQKGEREETSSGLFCEGTQAGGPSLAEAPEKASLEGTSLAANSEGTGAKTLRREWSDGNGSRSSPSPWPLTVYAWAPFTATGPAQNSFQHRFSAGRMMMNVRG